MFTELQLLSYVKIMYTEWFKLISRYIDFTTHD